MIRAFFDQTNILPLSCFKVCKAIVVQVDGCLNLANLPEAHLSIMLKAWGFSATEHLRFKKASTSKIVGTNGSARRNIDALDGQSMWASLLCITLSFLLQVLIDLYTAY